MSGLFLSMHFIPPSRFSFSVLNSVCMHGLLLPPPPPPLFQMKYLSNIVNSKKLQDEKELLENNCCPMHLKPCVLRKEDNYFFALSKYQKLLEETLTQNPDFVQPSFRLNEVRQ